MDAPKNEFPIAALVCSNVVGSGGVYGKAPASTPSALIPLYDLLRPLHTTVCAWLRSLSPEPKTPCKHTCREPQP